MRVLVTGAYGLIGSACLAPLRRDDPSPTCLGSGPAEARLAQLDLDWVILRPALVLGASVYGGSAMLRGLAGFPVLLPVAGADSKVQVVSMDDLADTVAFCLGPSAPAKVIWDLAHPEVQTLGDVVTVMRYWHGHPMQTVQPLSASESKVVGVLADALGWLGWRSPARSTAMAQLTAGAVGDPAAWMKATGITPKGLYDILAER